MLLWCHIENSLMLLVPILHDSFMCVMLLGGIALSQVRHGEKALSRRKFGNG